MKLGFDFTPALYDRGFSRYTTNLARALLEKAVVEMTFYGSSLRSHKKLVNRANRLIKTAQVINQPAQHFQHLPPTLLATLWRLGLNSIKNQLPEIEVF